MNNIFYLAFLVLGGSCFPSDNDSAEIKPRIVGGVSTDIKRVPYFAQILKFGKLRCGATLIDPQWVLTAAHCFDGENSGLQVITGSGQLGKGGELHTIIRLIIHRSWDEYDILNDIALVKLLRPVNVNMIQRPIDIISRPVQAGEKMRISGFGKQGENGTVSEVIKSAVITVVDEALCKKAYRGSPITDKMLCARDEVADACEGDSGGPGVIDGELAGIASFGPKCQSGTEPGVYTQVYKYRQWIEKVSGIVL